jgi:predicted metal-dependent hydrolase
MREQVRFGGITVYVTRKDVKHVHLSVHPPGGRVTLTAPRTTRSDVIRAYAVTRLAWIRAKQSQFRQQARETPRRFITRESHYLWGRRYLLTVVEADATPSVKLTHRRIILSVRPRSSRATRAAVIHRWHKALLHAVVPPLIAKWERRLGVKVRAYFLQRMKTKWGSCNHRAGNIRLNTELVKKPKDLLEYVVAHEMAHLIAPTHSNRFLTLMTRHYPGWRDARAELNELPLSANARARDHFGNS